MTYREAVEWFVSRQKSICLSDRCSEAERIALEALLAQGEPEYPTCERCGKKIDHINTSIFNHDGTDSTHEIPIQYAPGSGCVTFEINRNWTDYDLTDEERKEGIRCPYCGKYPFDPDAEIELYEPVEVMMWKTEEKPKGVEQA